MRIFPLRPLVLVILLTGSRAALAQPAGWPRALPAGRSSVKPAAQPAAQPTAQPRADSLPETAIRRYVSVPASGVALYERRTDARPSRRWPEGRKLYVQTVPDTTWFRVLLFGNSFFVRQREMPVPGWSAGTR